MTPPPTSTTHEMPRPARNPLSRLVQVGKQPKYPYVYALLTVVLATAVSFALYPFEDLANLIMVYLLASVIAATRLGRGPSIATTILGTAAFVYFFVPNRYSFVLADLTYLQTFTIMICVGLIVSALTSQLRGELLATEARERRSKALYQLSRGLAAAETRAQVAAMVPPQIEQAFGGPGALFELRGDRPTVVAASDNWTPTAAELETVRVVLTGGLPGHHGPLQLQPLCVAGQVVGAIGCLGTEPHGLTTPAERQLLEAFAHNVAVATQRIVVGEQVQSAHQRTEEERLRNVMLSSVSHDLRTPLASITGAVTTLIDSGARLDAPTRLDLMQAIREDADALERHVRNLLDLTRLEAGGMAARRDWHSLEEIVGCALQRVDLLLAGRPIDIDVPPDLVFVDALLIEQLLVNLLENAARYTPAGGPVSISGSIADGALRLAVTDCGPGIPPDQREQVFTKFYRGEGHRRATGAGLGLAICRAVVQLHGGEIQVTNRPSGGASFVATMPVVGNQPPPPSQPEELA